MMPQIMALCGNTACWSPQQEMNMLQVVHDRHVVINCFANLFSDLGFRMHSFFPSYILQLQSGPLSSAERGSISLPEYKIINYCGNITTLIKQGMFSSKQREIKRQANIGLRSARKGRDIRMQQRGKKERKEKANMWQSVKFRIQTCFIKLLNNFSISLFYMDFYFNIQ